MKNIKLQLMEKLGYGAGDLGNNFMFDMGQLYLLFFYTNFLQLPSWVAGSVFLTAKLFDAFIDTGVGAWADSRINIGTRGKFRPFILFGTVPLAVMTTICFIVPNFEQEGRIIWAFISYILFNAAYSVVNIPYGSMSAVMTLDGIERTKLANFRALGNQLGLFISGVSVMPLAELYSKMVNPLVGWAMAIGTMAVIGILCHLFCYSQCRERYVVAQKENGGNDMAWGVGFKYLFRNRPLLTFVVFTLLTIVPVYLQQQSQLYYFTYKFNAGKELMGLVSTLNIIAFIPMFFFGAYIVKRIGKKYTALIGAAGFSIMEILNYFVFGENVTTYLVCQFMAQTFLMMPSTVCWAIIADLIEYGQYISGLRTEGIVYSSYSFVRKVCQALAGFIPGMIFSMVGFNPKVQQQTVEAIAGIKMTYFLLPAFFCGAAALVFFFFYTLTEEKHKQIVAELDMKAVDE